MRVKGGAKHAVKAYAPEEIREVKLQKIPVMDMRRGVVRQSCALVIGGCVF